MKYPVLKLRNLALRHNAKDSVSLIVTRVNTKLQDDATKACYIGCKAIMVVDAYAHKHCGDKGPGTAEG